VLSDGDVNDLSALVREDHEDKEQSNVTVGTTRRSAVLISVCPPLFRQHGPLGR